MYRGLEKVVVVVAALVEAVCVGANCGGGGGGTAVGGGVCGGGGYFHREASEREGAVNIHLFTLFQKSTASFQLLLVSASFHGPAQNLPTATLSKPTYHAIPRVQQRLPSPLRHIAKAILAAEAIFCSG